MHNLTLQAVQNAADNLELKVTTLIEVKSILNSTTMGVRWAGFSRRLDTTDATAFPPR
jgi:hypothetical protein